jgi:hypothetical protein
MIMIPPEYDGIGRIVIYSNEPESQLAGAGVGPGAG